MYGIIQKGLKDMVCHTMGAEVWGEICKSAKHDDLDFEPLQAYPDSLTMSLVSACALRMQIPSEEVLRRFGRHWVLFTAKEGYGPILDLFGSDLRTCLSNLNRMHDHMGAMMPELRPPRFVVCGQDDTTMKLLYYSTRSGLAPMVLGLIEGLSEKFGEPVAIKRAPREEGSGHEEFQIEFRPG